MKQENSKQLNKTELPKIGKHSHLLYMPIKLQQIKFKTIDKEYNLLIIWF